MFNDAVNVVRRALGAAVVTSTLCLLAACGSSSDDNAAAKQEAAQVAAGRELFMQETFGNEQFFGATLGLHAVLNSVAPKDAVALGVQVDLGKVPSQIVAVMTGSDMDAKDVALNDPSVTRQLIKAGAVIGVKGFYATTDAALMS